ncbi:aspartyl-phosphate phosphatase Spo0E family protein [Schinkia sp. CFF1]
MIYSSCLLIYRRIDTMIIYKNVPNSVVQQIEGLRSNLIKSGLEKGFNHPTTIKLSQKLDKLLNKVQTS